jgi:predicted small lipoprotein YifL
MKTNFSHSLCILLTLLLAACGPLAPTPTVIP